MEFHGFKIIYFTIMHHRQLLRSKAFIMPLHLHAVVEAQVSISADYALSLPGSTDHVFTWTPVTFLKSSTTTPQQHPNPLKSLFEDGNSDGVYSRRLPTQVAVVSTSSPSQPYAPISHLKHLSMHQSH